METSSITALPEEFHQKVDAFEAAWRSADGLPPMLDEYVPPASSPHFAEGLAALVEVDLEFRWCRADQLSDGQENELGVRPLAESYIKRYPRLADNDILSELLSHEFQVRSYCGDTPDRESYRARFPDVYEHVTFSLASPNQSTARIDRPAEETILKTSDFGDYDILAHIASGGMGVVYKARHRTLNRIVALKTIKSGDLANDDEIRRFRTEAKAAAQLDHPNIVPIHEEGECDGRHFLSMSFVEGTGLNDRLKDGPLLPREAAALMMTIANAIHYAHEKGIVHRDLKPANVLIDADGQPRVTDFGLAKRITADSETTVPGDALGTPSYMPPEQAAGKSAQVGPLADVYALGALLYATLTGRPPHQAATQMATLQQVLEQEPVPPRQLNPSIDRDLETICLKCLEKNPAKRYASAHHLAADLDRYLVHKPILARPVGLLGRNWRWCRRNPAWSVSSAALVLVVVAGSLIARGIIRERNRRANEDKNSAIANGIVESLLAVDIEDVPAVVEKVARYRKWADPKLQAICRESPKGSKQRLHASLALLPVDPNQSLFLKERMLDSNPRHVRVIRSALVTHKNRLTNDLWRVLEEPTESDSRRVLRAASALALFDPDSERWTRTKWGAQRVTAYIVAPRVVDSLVGTKEVASEWMELLYPIRSRLLRPLEWVKKNRDKMYSEAEVLVATKVHSHFVGNLPPVSVDDFYRVNEDEALSISAPGVLANDNSPNGDSLTVEVVTRPRYGFLALRPSGAFDYTPNIDFVGVDSFTYRTNDGATHGNTAKVTITVKKAAE